MVVRGSWFAACRSLYHGKKSSSRLTAAVIVFKADDVVLHEVTTGLHFDHFERRDARVFQSVHHAQD